MDKRKFIRELGIEYTRHHEELLNILLGNKNRDIIIMSSRRCGKSLIRKSMMEMMQHLEEIREEEALTRKISILKEEGGKLANF